MAPTCENNFSERVLKRLRPHSCIIDAATGETIQSSDIRKEVGRFCASLRAHGLKPGDRILIGCLLSPSSCIAYLGAMYAGLVPVPLEQGVMGASAQIYIRETGARAAWTEEPVSLDGVTATDTLILHGLSQPSVNGEPSPVPRQTDDLAVLVATSGSTGIPRFVMVSHGNLIANTEAIISSQRLLDDERAMLILPLSYCFGASVLHSHLYQGGGVVFDRRFMFPDKVLRAIDTYRCTTFAGVPTVYNILLRRSNIRSIAMPSLRRFLQAGGPLAPQRIAEMREAVPHAEFFVMYGQTEATARISCLDPRHLEQKLGSAGRPLDNLAVRIVDEDGSEQPIGEVGEVIVRGPSITLGYLHDLEETGRTFKDGWLRTGDLGHLDTDGYLWIDGRKSAFLKIRGVRVGFADAEAKVAAVPGVYECAATSVPHAEAGEALALYIVPDKEEGDVIERVRRSLPASWTCESIQIVPQIPKTGRGKIDRASLPTMAVGNHA